MIFRIGPFTLYRVSKDDTLDITLTCLENCPMGWEYGWRDDMRGTSKPWIEFRIGKLMVFYFEPYKSGVEVWVMGFWLIV